MHCTAKCIGTEDYQVKNRFVFRIHIRQRLRLDYVWDSLIERSLIELIEPRKRNGKVLKIKELFTDM